MKKYGFITLLAVTTLVAGLTINQAETRAERSQTQLNHTVIPQKAQTIIVEDILPTPPKAQELAQLSITNATTLAYNNALCQSTETAFKQINKHVDNNELDRALSILRTLNEQLQSKKQTSTTQAQLAQTHLLFARVHLKDNNPKQALQHLAKLDKTTPIDDYKYWLMAEAHATLKQYKPAVDALTKVVGMVDSPMAHRARVQRAHILFEAKDYTLAATELEKVNTLYPDYPRRYIAMIQQAHALEATGKITKAAQLFHDTWFAYPFRPEGVQGKANAARLKKQGANINMPTLEERFSRYARLRINKHWDVARTLFLELEKDAIKAQGEHGELVHQIWMQLGRNAYIPKRYNEAFTYFDRLNKAFRKGHRKGISNDKLYEYHAHTLAKLGKLKPALRSVDRWTALYNDKSKLEIKVKFLKTHGEYKRARKLLEPTLTDAQKKSWSYTWTLYKSHQFKDALEAFQQLALKANGRRRAKYLYWAARSAERLGRTSTAKSIFNHVLAQHRYTYYGIQAKNRITDIERRKTPTPEAIATTQNLTKAAAVALNEIDKKPKPNIATDAMSFMLNEQREMPRRPDAMAPISLFDAPPCDTLTPNTNLICDIANTLEPTNTAKTPGPTLSKSLAFATLNKPNYNTIFRSDIKPKRHAQHTPHDNAKKRVLFSTPARIHWNGPNNSIPDFTRQAEGEVVGPFPKDQRAYKEKPSNNTLQLAIDKYGKLFPELTRAQWLHHIGMPKQARWAIRNVSLEYRALSRKPYPRSTPHQLTNKRMTPLIDNRRQRKATWGYIERDYRWPVPSDASKRKAMLQRQQEIISNKNAMYPILMGAFKEVGDYYMVRRLTLDKGGIRGSQTRRMQAYPRAFANWVLPAAKKYGVNPYILWALMTVESSYNPDSVSVAQALGLLQVIPRTGLKIAQLLGDSQFGHYDLLDEDIAIEHGAFYIAQVIKKFHGQELFAFAGYNGGPHRVAEWLDQRGNQPLDEFVEEIPYDQAREYTKKVTRFLALFLRTYEGIDDLYIGQTIQRDYTAQPNF